MKGVSRKGFAVGVGVGQLSAIFVGHLGGFVHFHKPPTMFKGEYHEYQMSIGLF